MKKTLLIFFILVFSVSSAFATGDDIEQQEDMLELIEEKLGQLDDSHRDFVNQKNAMVRNIRSLEDSVRNTEGEIEKLNGDIELNKVEIGKATLELAAAKQVLEETTDLMDDRLRIMYMNGTIGYLEVILDSKNFEDLLTRIEMLQRIVESDTALIDQMDRDKQLVDEKKQNLEAEQEKLLALENELQGKRSQLKAQINDLEVQKFALESDIAALEIQIDDTYADAERVKNIIAELELLQQYVGGEMTWPVPGEFRVTSPFGMRLHPILNIMKLHTGIDIGGNGNTVVAANNGKVIWSNWLSSYGKCIMIDHGGGLVTLYAHNQSLTVKKGEDVTRGQNIAVTGSTGNVTGAHLHFEVRKDGEFVDPMEYVKGN